MAKIGIDLGTTFSCVAIYRNQLVEVIPNDNGKRTTPSIVSFYENQRLIGEEAKSLMGINPQNTIYGIKRLIGRRFDEKIVQDDIGRWPFEVIDDQNRPNIKVQYKNANTFLHPEEVSAMILEKMKEIAEKYLRDKVEAAVITVPAYFNDGQRKATKQAAEIAQLKVLRIINEPTAAAIAYGLNIILEGGSALQKVVIFDFGGGTLDVTVLVIEDGVFDVKSTNGDTHLGGEDFDNRLVVHCLKEIKKKFNKTIAKNEKALNKLKMHCELAKINLSTSEATTINIAGLIDGEDFIITISREMFDQLTAELIDKVMQPVEDALRAANFDVSEISNVVLVGGSTKIVKIQNKLRDYFPQSQINMNINPDEAVATGAAIHAAKLAGTDADELREIVLMDVTPLSLGIQVAGGNMAVIIPRNTTVPVTKNKTFTTMKDNQTMVTIQVYEGERPLTHYNNFLGEVKLSGITPDKVGVPQIEVNFHIDSDGVLNCTAIEKREGKTPKDVTVQSKAGHLSKEEVTRMVEKAKEFRKEDELEKERINAKLTLDSLCNRFYSFMTDASNYGKDVNLRDHVILLCGETQSWLSDNPNLLKEEYEKKYREIHDECDPIRRKILNMHPEKCFKQNEDTFRYDAVDE